MNDWVCTCIPAQEELFMIYKRFHLNICSLVLLILVSSCEVIDEVIQDINCSQDIVTSLDSLEVSGLYVQPSKSDARSNIQIEVRSDANASFFIDAKEKSYLGVNVDLFIYSEFNGEAKVLDVLSMCVI